MAEETRIIRLKLEDAEKVRRELEEIKRLRDELSKPAGGGGTAAGMASGAAGAGMAPGMTAGAGGFVPGAAAGMPTLGPASATEFARMAENIVRQSVAELVQRPLQNAMGRISAGSGPVVGGGADTIMRGRRSALPPIAGGSSVIVPAALTTGAIAFGEIEEALSALPPGETGGMGGIDARELVMQRRLRAAGYGAAGVPAGMGLVPMGPGFGRGRPPSPPGDPIWMGGGDFQTRAMVRRPEAEAEDLGYAPRRRRPASAEQEDIIEAEARPSGRGRRRDSDPLMRASFDAFGSAMLGLTYLFGAMPLQQFSQGNVTAAQQLTYDPTRVALNQRQTQAQIALGRQTESFRQSVTGPLGIAALEGLAAAGMGGPMDAIATAGMGAGQFFNALSPVLATVGLANAALPGLSGRLGGMAGRAGRLALPVGLGIGGMEATGALAGLSGQMMQGMGMPEQMASYFAMLAGGPFRALGSVGQLGNRGGQWLGQQFGFGTVQEQPPPVDLRSGTVRAVMTRQLAESERALTDPQTVAAEREMLTRSEASLGFAQARFRLGFAEQDLGISRQRFDEGQRLEREDLATEGFRAATDIGIRFDRSVREIDIGVGRRQRDIGISAGRAREDVSRNQARSIREVNIGEAESIEDVNTNFQRGVRDTILGSVLTGLPGALVGLALRRNDALQDVRRNAARGRSRIGRSAGDALGDIGIGEDRAREDADQAGRDARQDAGRVRDYALADLDREQDRRADDLKRRQDREAAAFEEQEKRQKQMLSLAQAELDIRQRLNNQLTATTPELIKQIQAITKAFETGSTDIDNARKRIREAQTGMMEGAVT